jgi:hypothetical protein
MEKIKIQTVMIKHSNSELEVLKSFANRVWKKKTFQARWGQQGNNANFGSVYHTPQTTQISNWVA